MTAIGGLVRGEKVYIGGDSAGVQSYQITVRRDEKVFLNGDILVGCCGSFRMRDLLRHKFIAPARSIREDLDVYMRTTFVDAVMRCFQEGKFAEMDKEVQRGGSFLVGIEGRLYHIEDDFQIGEALAGYDAIGNADDVVLGSLFTTQRLDLPPQRCLELALEAAESHTTDVRRPFHIIESL